MSKALIAMSGGVDSSIAAYLAQQEGYECIGCTMKLYNSPDIGITSSRTCCSLDDAEDARSVAYKLGMRFYVFNFTDEFLEKVVRRFVQSYESGATPNPCINCNRYLKFDKLHERAKILGCDCVVTGHYARIEYDGSRYLLKKALDETKDQSYVLYSMTQEQLAHTLFPLGNIRKSEVRRMAEANGFCNAYKHDSQDICFVPDGDYAKFLEFYTGKKYPCGDFVGTDGKVLGRHSGIIRYTVGQRKGLGLSLSKPMYVNKINVKKNTVVLGTDKELYGSVAVAENFNMIYAQLPATEIRCKVKVRYRQKEQWATVTAVDSATVQIIFDEPQRAITSGQAAVLYDGDIVLGGGTII